MAVCQRRLAISDRLWSITTRLGSFGSTLGLILQRDGGRLQPHRIDANATHWSMPWPNWATRSDGKLCLGAALALADEISSYGGMACWDKNARAGITLSISAMLATSDGTPSVRAGEELHYVSRKLKTGRQIGYMELEVWRGAPSDDQYFGSSSSSQPSLQPSSSSAELLAIGRHSKMLPFSAGAPLSLLLSRPLSARTRE